MYEKVLKDYEDLKSLPEGESDNLKKVKNLQEEIDYLILEHSSEKEKTDNLRKIKKEIKTILKENPSKILNKNQILNHQKKMLYDCQEIALNVGNELNRQEDKLTGSEKKIFNLNGKLLNSSGLVVTVQRNMRRNKIIFKIAICLIFVVLALVLVVKIF